uniref:Uncharacterized protein n=1 Tax=Arundo donax TaxID=35708 RepID=A0A0A8YQ89_ARUDO
MPLFYFCLLYILLSHF